MLVSARVLMLGTAMVSAAVMVRLSVPAISAFLFFEVPRIYKALVIWLTPPYLYFVINGIIISIAASSRFQKVALEEEGLEAVAIPEVRPDPPPPPAAAVVEFQIGDGAEELDGSGRRMKDDDAGGGVVVRDGDDEDFVISRSSWTPKSRYSREVAPAAELESPAAEKPLVSERFGSRRSVKASPEGRPLGVARPKKSETLENTWKTITDGRPMPLTRHLRKSDTWGTDGKGREATASPPVRKSETFSEQRVTTPSPSASPGRSGGGSGRLIRREPSPGQDELNRRVEAFIKKFNEEMRLQRQDSFKHYMDMISRTKQQ
ncbi:unnamed protein product [Spirodela intermedia]|uniref:DUF4408 domain-containing protein n=2 Tax=Spirodela intermedia TaxID=51605 RepID=A0A7I8ILM2_SPIIN|nr:unnamed protein product [Spirodela intermedia]CAA6658418.1 unnamed protein product [Spirodela intermedia]CAA7394675.1 unnamed protein product [Spirodela intermedia]